MAKRRGPINQLQDNSWLYEIDFKRDEFTQEVLNHNLQEIKQLLKIAYDNPDNSKLKHIEDLLDELESKYFDFELQAGTMAEAEEEGEQYIMDNYEMTVKDVEDEIIYALDGIFDILDARITSEDGRNFKFCWAGIN